MLSHFIQGVEVLRGNPLSLPVFVGIYAAACFVAPVSVFPVAGGVLFGFGWGFFINLVAVLLGASGPFWLARRLGHQPMAAFFRRKGYRGMAGVLRNPGAGAFILIRLVGFPPFVVTNYLAGLSGMRWRRFLWTSLVGLLPWTFVMTYFAGTFWEILVDAGLSGFRRSVLDHSRPLLWGAGVILATLSIGVWARRRIKPAAPAGD